MFMLLLAASTAVTQELYLDEKTMPHVHVIVSCIYGRLFLYLMNSKSDATYTRTYLLMQKQCLMFMLLLAHLSALRKIHRQLQKRERTGKEYGCFPFV